MSSVILLLTILTLGFFSLKSLKNPGYALGILWAMFSVEQYLQSASGFFVQYRSLVNFGITGLAIWAIGLSYLRGQLPSLKLTRQHFWWLGLMLWTCLSLLWSVNYGTSMAKLKENAPYIIAFVLVGPYCLSAKQLPHAVRVTLVLGTLILLGIATTGFGRRSIVITLDTGQTTEGNPLAIATYGGYVAICCVFSLYAQRNTLKSFGKLLMIGLILLSLYCIVRTGSRGQLIFVAVACFIWLPITAKMAAKRSSIMALGFGFCIVLVGIYILAETGVRRWESQFIEQASNGRLNMCTKILKANYDAGAFAWLGGLGTSSSFVVVGFYPHNVPVEVLAEEGIIGAFCLVGFLFSVTFLGYRTLRQPNLDPDSRLQVGILLALFTFEFGLGLKQGSMLGSVGLFGTGLCIAMSAAKLKAKRHFPNMIVQSSAHPMYGTMNRTGN